MKRRRKTLPIPQDIYDLILKWCDASIDLKWTYKDKLWLVRYEVRKGGGSLTGWEETLKVALNEVRKYILKEIQRKRSIELRKDYIDKAISQAAHRWDTRKSIGKE